MSKKFRREVSKHGGAVLNLPAPAAPARQQSLLAPLKEWDVRHAENIGELRDYLNQREIEGWTIFSVDIVTELALNHADETNIFIIISHRPAVSAF